MIAEYLSADLTSLEETLYQGVLRLPPAHCLRVSAAGISKRRYWDVDLSRQVRHSTDAGYAESFQDVFAEAVRCRFRGTGPVAAELSGGVDSSSVVGMCRTLFQKGTVPERGFETFSLVFPGQACDESAYVRKVVQFCSVTSNEVAVPPDHLWYANCAKTYSDLPDHANFHMSDFASDRAREKGFGVILTGLGGDDWFTGCPPPSRWSRVRRALRPLRHALEGPACRRPPWIPAGFASRVGLGCTARSTQSALRFASQTQRLLYEGLSDPYRLHCLEMKARASARCGVEHRHPLHDRRLIELALALPADQLWRGGESKSVMRRAMAGLVPDAVINRRTKAEFSTTTAQLFASDGIAPIFRSLLIAEQGWVDGPRVAIMYDEFMQAWRAGSEYLPRVWPLSMILGVELWFRAVFAEKVLL
jgi:asparagine synthase (glutamine-hydrolysing)